MLLIITNSTPTHAATLQRLPHPSSRKLPLFRSRFTQSESKCPLGFPDSSEFSFDYNLTLVELGISINQSGLLGRQKLCKDISKKQSIKEQKHRFLEQIPLQWLRQSVRGKA